jgi:hypothetical protein
MICRRAAVSPAPLECIRQAPLLAEMRAVLFLLSSTLALASAIDTVPEVNVDKYRKSPERQKGFPRFTPPCALFHPRFTPHVCPSVQPLLCKGRGRHGGEKIFITEGLPFGVPLLFPFSRSAS